MNDAIPDEGENRDVDLVPSEPSDLAADVQAPLADQVVVDAHADELAKIWHADHDYDAPTWPMNQQQLEQLLPGAIRAAASTFPVGTGLGADNIAPRAFVRKGATQLATVSR